MEKKRDLTTLSDGLLFAYLGAPEFRSAESMKDIIAELQRRGHVLTEKQLNKAKQTSDDPVDNIYTGVPTIHKGWKSRGTKYNVVDDVNAPLLYSQQAIGVFSFLFGVIFGAVLIALNVKHIGHRGKATWIIVCGALYMIIEIIVLNKIDAGSLGPFIGNGLGLLLMDFIWHRYIGYNTLYRAKAIWTPLIIAIIIYVPIILLILYGKIVVG